ncbi:DUF4145 domain-containing protein [Hymenobacter ruricola]|uniref:DUF4145 domain-containing protein n=1 Tax=Hymenobacter ruricola TaxID=2791023 RepID=A0ABS0I563_9BACT|nr:DUF4145 domain-containing protein [Hymenobacter ruricola]MBF9222087.1 DUF4145 domain-containing protein [Hymenobacter ruricola]
MSSNRDLWLNASFTKTACPEWNCPTCKTGKLTVAPANVYSTETRDSIQHRDDPDWEAYWISYKFSASLKCDNAKCADVVVTSGWGSVEEGYIETDNDWYSEYYDSFRPEFFTPHLNYFTIESACPKIIQDEINKSFSLFFLDAHSCANKIRIAIELLMNEFKIPSSRINKGKRIGLSLHARIIKFGLKYPKITNALLAIKWIGNAGSHTSPIEKKDIIDAYDILEHSLTEIFSTKTKETEKIVKEINKKKAPRSKGKQH